MKQLSQILSIIFSPMIVPTYAFGLLIFTSYISVLPSAVLWWVLGTVCAMTCLLPLLMLWLMKVLRLVDNLDVTDRRQRLVPYLVIWLCYCFSYTFLQEIQLPPPALSLWFGALLAIGLLMVISTFWKISGHAAALGATVVMLWMEMLSMMTVCDIFPIFVVAVLITGIVATARVLLGRHTVMQTICGALVGGAGVLLPWAIQTIMAN